MHSRGCLGAFYILAAAILVCIEPWWRVLYLSDGLGANLSECESARWFGMCE